MIFETKVGYTFLSKIIEDEVDLSKQKEILTFFSSECVICVAISVENKL